MPLLVFMYHRVLPEPHPEAVDLPLFRRQLDYMQENFQLLTPDECCRYIRDGIVLAGKKCCAALTFDDGWADNLFYATDELKKRGLQAMMAVSAGFAHSGSVRETIDRETLLRPIEKSAASARAGDPASYLNEAELKMLMGSGVWSLEAHGTRHMTGSLGKSVLAAPQGESDAEFAEKLRADILNSRRYLDNLTGRTGKVFFWPYGHYSNPAAQIVRECGYDIQFSVYKGACKPADRRLVLPRIGVSRWKKFHKNSIVFRNALLEKLHGLFHTEKVCFDDFYQEQK